MRATSYGGDRWQPSPSPLVRNAELPATPAASPTLGERDDQTAGGAHGWPVQDVPLQGLDAARVALMTPAARHRHAEAYMLWIITCFQDVVDDASHPGCLHSVGDQLNILAEHLSTESLDAMAAGDDRLIATRDNLKFDVMIQQDIHRQRVFEQSGTLETVLDRELSWRRRVEEIEKAAIAAEAEFDFPSNLCFEDVPGSESDLRLVHDVENTNEPVHAYVRTLEHLESQLEAVPSDVQLQHWRGVKEQVRGMLELLHTRVECRRTATLVMRGCTGDFTEAWKKYYTYIIAHYNPVSLETRLGEFLQPPIPALRSQDQGEYIITQYPKNPHSVIAYIPESAALHDFLHTAQYLAEEFEHIHSALKGTLHPCAISSLAWSSRARMVYARCTHRMLRAYLEEDGYLDLSEDR